MSTHTPGPWLAEFSEACVVRSKHDGGRVAIIANLRGPHGMGGRRSSAEVEANTRLIAAAPDLLEALDLLLNDVGRASSLPGAVLARAAIKQATEVKP